MSHYKRNQQGRLRNSGLERHEQLNRREEDVYGEGKDYRREGYKPPFPVSNAEAPQARRISGPRYGDRQDEDSGNYGRGGYYGGTYEQKTYNRERGRNMGFGQNYQRIDERDDNWGGWRENEPLGTRGYRSDEEGRTGSAGIHRGKGPRGYQRSDERIKDDVNDRLADDSFIDASDIVVDVRNAEVTLSGTVESRDAKRLAEDIGESVSGVKNVENRLRVKRNTDWTNRDGNSEDRTVETPKSNRREATR